MKAVRVAAFGGYEQMELKDTPTPVPQPGQVLARVAAAGVGPWDGWILAGKSALPQPLPLTLGADFAGEVVAVGDGVDKFVVGDQVYGVVNTQFTGAWAEFAAAEAAMIAKAPKGMESAEAASTPIVAVTAWQALFVEAGLRRGQSVLILGAAGNVGAYAVQMARDAGIAAIATASAADAGYVRSLGARQIVDARSEGFETSFPSVDAVIDLIGGEAQRRAFAALSPGGRLISAVSSPDADLAAANSIEARFFLVGVRTERLDALTALLESRRVITQLGAVLPLAECRTALGMVEGALPRPRGKVVLEPLAIK